MRNTVASGYYLYVQIWICVHFVCISMSYWYVNVCVLCVCMHLYVFVCCVCVCVYAYVCVKAMIFVHVQLFYSCWIDSDDGAIAAFIVPIVAIMLVCSIRLNSYK